jgi:hypothetical protein
MKFQSNYPDSAGNKEKIKQNIFRLVDKKTKKKSQKLVRVTFIILKAQTCPSSQ